MSDSTDKQESSVGGITIECIDYSGQLNHMEAELEEMSSTLEALVVQNEKLYECETYSTGFLLFGVIVVLCAFGYKFIRMFI